MILHTCYSVSQRGGGLLTSTWLFDSPVHSDLDAALGVPGDQVVAGDDLVMKAMLKMVTKVAMLALLTRNLYLIRPVHMAPSILLHHHSCWDQPLKTVLALVCSKSSLIFNPRVCWLLQQCTLMNTIHFLTWVADWILPTCHWPTMI